MSTQKQNTNQLASAFCNPLQRFPLAVAIAAALALASIPSLNGGDQRGGEFRALLQPGLEAAFLWTVAAALWGESRKSAAAAWIAAVAGFAVIFVMLGYPWSIPAYLQGQWTPTWSRFGFLALWEHNRHSLAFLPFVLFALILFIGLAPYLRADSDREAFWRFNQKLWLAAFLALIAMVLLLAGELAFIRSIEKHFSFSMSELWKNGIARIAPLLFLGPVLWLSMLPTTFDDKPDRNTTPEFALQAIALLVKFVFIPLTLIFSSIILVYVAMVIAKGAVPPAILGDGASWLSVTIILTALLSYPIRREGRLVRVYWLIWPWLLVTPAACSAVAAYIDIEQHGATPEQCAQMGTALGMLIISSAFLSARSHADIRLIPGALIVVALLGSFGPWGAVAMSARSQQAVVTSLFSAHGLIKGGHWTGVASTEIKWPDDERRRASSSLKTLSQLDAVSPFASWFEGRDDSPFRGQAPFATLERMANLSSHNPLRSDSAKYFSFFVRQPLLLPLENIRLYAGTYQIYFWDSMRSRNPKTIETGVAALGTLSMDYDANSLIILSADGRRASFDLGPTVQRLASQGDASSQTHFMVREDKPIILSSAEAQLNIQLVVTLLEAWMTEGKSSMKACDFALLIGADQTVTAN